MGRLFGSVSGVSFFGKFSFPSFDARVSVVLLYDLFSKGGCFMMIFFTHHDCVYKRV
jgi:hypothetical protein